MFNRFDRDKNGTLEFDEFVKACEVFGFRKHEAKKAFRHYDTDHSGTIDFEEFTKIYKSGFFKVIS